eukprot:CAMPEP_0167763426 /NCGR_PEP_ID=MMETSP0110_2-20121227/13367_1 /TAXON_ID=629695 /ORGANISM="Gymnochlora sp., Strain CCMP2014" /LENGTH=184 /DNA_ID=CAMNT_0007650511 /DNA_START=656 /DNA_END=1210 /DNA_ORIENTATION=-
MAIILGYTGSFILLVGNSISLHTTPKDKRYSAWFNGERDPMDPSIAGSWIILFLGTATVLRYGWIPVRPFAKPLTSKQRKESTSARTEKASSPASKVTIGNTPRCSENPAFPDSKSKWSSQNFIGNQTFTPSSRIQRHATPTPDSMWKGRESNVSDTKIPIRPTASTSATNNKVSGSHVAAIYV